VFEKSRKESELTNSGGIVPLVHCGIDPVEVIQDEGGRAEISS
jgi:hypothetical protein